MGCLKATVLSLEDRCETAALCTKLLCVSRDKKELHFGHNTTTYIGLLDYNKEKNQKEVGGICV